MLSDSDTKPDPISYQGAERRAEGLRTRETAKRVASCLRYALWRMRGRTRYQALVLSEGASAYATFGRRRKRGRSYNGGPILCFGITIARDRVWVSVGRYTYWADV